MRSSKQGGGARRVTRLEVLEDRRVLAADIPIFTMDAPELVTHDVVGIHEEVASMLPVQGSAQASELETHFNGVHAATGVDTVKNRYGFDGTGQTVAIIDTGIAWDHLALGAGYGAGARVVGGWDFAENDANPYDDGPGGFHGTHVAGIVGSDNNTFEGVAPGVDLVALRVFDDMGNGDFAWVEQALQWLHDHKDDFENPITTVNLSLGGNWNSDNTPSWAMLEDEFAQLEADGMFISVSAGNSFQSFGQTTGLSYPAASQYVVPVASVGNDGQLSGFSQRNDRVLAAPGESIASTVPDHLFGADGYANDYASASGTSMAAPYVAGSAVLVRQAMEFAGYQNITQDMIYDHFRDTADLVYDSVTDAWYHMINVERAISELMPADEYGNSAGSATTIGSVSDGDTFNGSLTTLTDTDFISFTAAATGTMTLTGSGTDGNALAWNLLGHGSSPAAGAVTFDVIAGQEYVVAVNSTGKLGHYNFSVAMELAEEVAEEEEQQDDQQQEEDEQVDVVVPINLGTVDYLQATATGSGSRLYAVTAGQTGLLSVRGTGAEDATFTLYDANMTQLGTTSARVDHAATAGGTYYVEVNSAGNVDLELVNLVSLDAGVLTVNGTAGDDALRIEQTDSTSVSINGFTYDFSVNEIQEVLIDGQGGTDTLAVVLGNTNDTATLNRNSLTVSNSLFNLIADNLHGATISSDGGSDVAIFNGTAGDDLFQSNSSESSLTSGGVTNSVTGFATVTANAGTGGDDTAYFYDGAGDDTFTGGQHSSSMVGSNYSNTANGFGSNYAFSQNGGNDRAILQDTTGNDTFESNGSVAVMRGDSLHNQVEGFSSVQANSTGGTDTANLTGSAGSDRLVAWHDRITFTGSTFNVTANGFEITNTTAGSGGVDHAIFYDSVGNDLFTGGKTSATMSGNGFNNTASGFGWKFAYSVYGGNDSSVLLDSAGNDTFTVSKDYAMMRGDGLYNYARGFSTVTGSSTGGVDTANLFGTSGNDRFLSYSDRATLSGSGYSFTARNFANVLADAGSGGVDHAFFYDSVGDDIYTGGAKTGSMTGKGFSNTATGFGWNFAYSKLGGNDTAIFNGTTGNDNFYGSHNYSLITGRGLYNYAENFSFVAANSGGGTDTATLVGGAGNDRFLARANTATLSCSGCSFTVNDFAKVTAIGGGGVDHAFFYDSAGNDVFHGGKATSSLSGSGFNNTAQDFGWKFAYSIYGGQDTAIFDDTSGNDTFTTGENYSIMHGKGLYNYARGFANVEARSSGGIDTANFTGSNGADTVASFSGRIQMQSAGRSHTATGFTNHNVDLRGGAGDLVYLYEMLGETLNEMSGEVSYTRSGGGSERFLTDADFATYGGEDSRLSKLELENLDYVFETL